MFKSLLLYYRANLLYWHGYYYAAMVIMILVNNYIEGVIV